MVRRKWKLLKFLRDELNSDKILELELIDSLTKSISDSVYLSLILGSWKLLSFEGVEERRGERGEERKEEIPLTHFPPNPIIIQIELKVQSSAFSFNNFARPLETSSLQATYSRLSLSLNGRSLFNLVFLRLQFLGLLVPIDKRKRIFL